MKLRKLNDAGLERMRAFLDSLTTDVPEKYPVSILSDPATSEDLQIEVDVDGERRFNRRFEVALYLYES
jgi:hypothetical protein